MEQSINKKRKKLVGFRSWHCLTLVSDEVHAVLRTMQATVLLPLMKTKYNKVTHHIFLAFKSGSHSWQNSAWNIPRCSFFQQPADHHLKRAVPIIARHQHQKHSMSNSTANIKKKTNYTSVWQTDARQRSPSKCYNTSDVQSADTKRWRFVIGSLPGGTQSTSPLWGPLKQVLHLTL